MIDLSAVDGLFAAIGHPDPGELVGQLALMSSAGLRQAADRALQVARELDRGVTMAQQSIGQLTVGWSATMPRLGPGRLIRTAEETAALLGRQAAVIEATGTVIDQAKSDAVLDVALAMDTVHAVAQHGWLQLKLDLFGEGQFVFFQLVAISRRLYQTLADRIATVDAAVAALSAALAADPTSGPDGLRVGPAAVLPPDPVLNPAHRTDGRNRLALAADQGSDNPARATFAMSILASLDHARDRGGTAQLVVYDPTAFKGQGRAAISVGDLATAANVAVVVPGIGNSPSSMSGGIDLAANLRDEADRQEPTEPTAVIAWYGYDIPMSWPKDPASGPAMDLPDTIAIASAISASQGAPFLAADLTAIRSMSQVSDQLSVLGFSMGSTTVSEAARYELPVDSIVLLGSPGAGWDTATAGGYRNVPAEDVFVLSYDQDPVTRPVTDLLAAWGLGSHDPYGPDPASEDFGARDIDVTTNVPLLTGTGLLPTLALVLGDPRHHSMNNYMQGRALVAEGSIVVGRKDEVPIKPGR